MVLDQDHGLVSVVYLQTVLVAQLQAERFLLLNNAKGNFQSADSLSGHDDCEKQVFDPVVSGISDAKEQMRDGLLANNGGISMSERKQLPSA